MKKGLEGTYKMLADLPEGSVVGTSSVRRVAGLRRDYPKLKFMDVVSSSFLLYRWLGGTGRPRVG